MSKLGETVKRAGSAIHPMRWFHDWEDRILVENWIPIRYQPILFVFLFIGIIFVIIRRPTLPSMTAMAGPIAAYIWLVLALACPPILFIAWLLIHFCHGRKTYFGYWMRFAADIGQVFSFMAYLVALLSDPTPETEDAYAQIILGSILAFLLIIVMRDVLKLILLERTSSSVQRVQDLQDAQDVIEAAEIKEILDARDAADIADVRAGIESTRQKVAKSQLQIGHLTEGAAASLARETEWSLHQDHKVDKADEPGGDDAGS